jgi:hypothetical protein
MSIVSRFLQWMNKIFILQQQSKYGGKLGLYDEFYLCHFVVFSEEYPIMATIVSLVSDQIAPIILGALHYKPSHMVFIRSGSEKYAQNVERICGYLKQELAFTYEEHIVDPYNFENVLAKMRGLSASFADKPFLCNITGGTKVMALAAFQAMNERGMRSFYIDTDNSRLMTFQETKVEAEPFDPRLTVDDFVNIIGATIDSEQTPWFQNDKRLAALGNLIFRHHQEWQQTNRYFHAVQRYFPTESLEVSAPFQFTDPNGKIRIRPDIVLLQELNRLNLVTNLRLKGRHVEFRYADQTAKMMLFSLGLWLEYHVYETIVRLQEQGVLHTDDLRAGVVLNWDAAEPSEHPVVNEIDVMVTKGSKLFCISCKAGDIKDTAKVLNEIELYSRRLGGIYYYPALVLVHPPNRLMRKRAELTNVKLFVLGERFPEELAAWLMGKREGKEGNR